MKIQPQLLVQAHILTVDENETSFEHAYVITQNNISAALKIPLLLKY